MATKFNATPLFDAHKKFVRLPMGMAMFDDYPDSKQFIVARSNAIPEMRDDALHTQSFLKSYSRKSEATFRTYRNEVERLLLWAWTIANKSVIQLKRPDLEAYFDFVNAPNPSWVAASVQDRFKMISGEYVQNPEWRPFAAKIAKEDRAEALAEGQQIKVTTDAHRLSHEAMKISYSAISCFYDYLTDEGYAFGNPIPAIRKQSAYLIKGKTTKNIKRLSDLQWEVVLESVELAADKDPLHERTLFIIAMLKTLYLRVSELSERANWQPAWKHFWRDNDGNHWLKVLGKGNKVRDVSVPSALSTYIHRYQVYRAELNPDFGANSALVAKTRGAGGMTSRQLRRIVQQGFDLGYERMRSEGFNEEAATLREATTHWLRHTGASQDIATRPLKHMADDLGHASMGTTDQVYIQSDMKERAQSGEKRKV